MTDKPLLNLRITAGDAEMVVSWAEDGLKGQPSDHYGRGSCDRFREAFNEAARESLATHRPGHTNA